MRNLSHTEGSGSQSEVVEVPLMEMAYHLVSRMEKVPAIAEDISEEAVGIKTRLIPTLRMSLVFVSFEDLELYFLAC